MRHWTFGCAMTLGASAMTVAAGRRRRRACLHDEPRRPMPSGPLCLRRCACASAGLATSSGGDCVTNTSRRTARPFGRNCCTVAAEEVTHGMDRVRLAIVGCGNISQLNAPGYLQHPRCDVVALCDTDPERAKRRAREWGITPRLYSDFAQVLDDSAVDAVELLDAHLDARRSDRRGAGGRQARLGPEAAGHLHRRGRAYRRRRRPRADDVSA